MWFPRTDFVTVSRASSGYVVVTDNEEERNVNVVTLIGNLATEVEVRDVGDGKRVASFLLAVDRRTKEGGADFVRVSAWDRQADACGQYLTKGRRVAIDGYLRSRSWEDQGKRRRDVEVVARSVQFLSPPEGAAAEIVPFEPAVAS
jgi:single-strand DNA-binding protein